MIEDAELQKLDPDATYVLRFRVPVTPDVVQHAGVLDAAADLQEMTDEMLATMGLQRTVLICNLCGRPITGDSSHGVTMCVQGVL